MKKFKKIMSLTIVVALLLCSLPLTANAIEGLSIKYDFANDNPGYAQGTITIDADAENCGNYYLYWADDSAALDGYYDIAKLDVSSGKGEFTFLENIAIPTDAKKLIAIKADSEPTDKTVENATVVYELPENKLNKHTSSDKTLSFEALSDTQLDEQSMVFYTYSLEHFAKALEDAADRNVDFVTVSGDCVNAYENGNYKEWQTYQKIIADSSFTNPIYEANGNHSMNGDRAYGLDAFVTATGLGVDSESRWNNPWYEITADNGDHFIFAALETSSSVGTTDEFSDEQLDWLESTIEKYYNDGHHIFVFEHAFFHGYGPGDDKVNHYYSGGLRTTDAYPGNKRFKEIFDKYTELFLYTGHSHFDFEYNWNYDNENGQTANLFHIPATACTTHVVNGKLDYTMDENASQCYIVDCYDDMVISNGLNVVDNKIYPQYTYIVDTSEYTHEPVTSAPTESTTESSEMIDVQIDNGTSYLYDGGASTVALYFYNNDSGNYYKVDNKTGIAQIPENATDLTLYRCENEWGGGNKSDFVTTYWNKYGPTTRELEQKIFYVGGSSSYYWKAGEISYPEEETSTDPSEDVKPVEPTETTIYWAIPQEYTDSGYTYKMNIRTVDGKYPHSARILTDTGLTYNGMAVYSYTFSKEYVEEYDTAGINRIQMQGASSTSSSATVYFQYAFEDKTYTISELRGKILVSPDAAPTGTISSDINAWVDYCQEETTDPTEEENGEITIYWAIPQEYTDSGYTYRMNIRTVDGKYPHSARILTDTGLTYYDMAVYSYTFSKEYVEEYDAAGINRIQMQAAESTSSSAKTYFQYTFEDKTYTISELKGKILASPDTAPTGTISSDISTWVDYDPQGKYDPTEAPSEESTTYPSNENLIEIQVTDNTSSGWVYAANAKLFIYDLDTQLRYEVVNEKVKIPDTAVNLVVYRCEKEWNKGNKTDDVTTYWNKWELTPRAEGFDIIYLSGDDKSSWLSSQTQEPEEDVFYYLIGYFDNADYDGRDYQFDENGHLSIKFMEDSYVYVVSSSNTSYWTNGYLGTDVKEATLYRVSSISDADKMYVASGKVNFTLTVNDDGTLGLSVEYEPIEYDGTELDEIYDVKIGDVNFDGEVDIRDVTLIQKYLAEMTDLTNEQKFAADVYGNGKLNIRIATLIQMYIAKAITVFPADSEYEPDVSTLDSLIDETSRVLYRDYRYASYVAYSKLKTQYYKYKDIDVSQLDEENSLDAYSQLLAAYNNFRTMKENNNVVTVYFCDYSAWNSVKAYVSNSETGEGLNTLDTTKSIPKIKTLPSGAKIYEITVDRSKWDKIVFTDGDTARTVELDIPTQNYVGFFIPDDTKDENGYYIPSKFRYTYDRM